MGVSIKFFPHKYPHFNTFLVFNMDCKTIAQLPLKANISFVVINPFDMQLHTKTMMETLHEAGGFRAAPYQSERRRGGTEVCVFITNTFFPILDEQRSECSFCPQTPEDTFYSESSSVDFQLQLFGQ